MSFVAAATSTWWCPGPSGGSRAHLSFPVAKNKHLRVTIAAEGNAKTAPAQAVPWRTGLFGFVPLAAHGLYADGLSNWSLLCWRYLFALVIISAGIRLARLYLRAAMRQGTWQIALVRVSLGAIQTLCYFQSPRRLDTGIAVLCSIPSRR